MYAAKLQYITRYILKYCNKRNYFLLFFSMIATFSHFQSIHGYEIKGIELSKSKFSSSHQIILKLTT